MIILDEEDQRRTKQDPYAAGPTLRFPEKAAGRSDSPLPDYETSEARQQLILKNLPQRKVDPRLWRAILYALAIYVTLSVAIGVPIIVLVCSHPLIIYVPFTNPRCRRNLRTLKWWFQILQYGAMTTQILALH